MNTVFHRLICEQINAALWECCPPELIHQIRDHDIFAEIVSLTSEDALSFTNKDPASERNPLNIINSYTSFKAVLHYRIANTLLKVSQLYEDVHSFSSILSSRGKLLSGAEIHHRSKIGRRLILDHGVGTVIGETSDIGDDCYILGGVTLGASGISNNPNGKRHPTIGNRVQIGAYSKIFGDIKIGDDVFIGPNCVISQDIPSKSKITLKSSIQVCRNDFAN